MSATKPVLQDDGTIKHVPLPPDAAARRQASFAKRARALAAANATAVAAKAEAKKAAAAEQRIARLAAKKAEHFAEHGGGNQVTDIPAFSGPASPDDVLPLVLPPPLLTAPMTGGVFHPTLYQSDVLAIPETYSPILAGARGTGKSVGAQQAILQHCALYAEGAKVLVVRQHLRSLSETETELQLALAKAYPSGVKFDRQNHLARLPGGATIEFAPLSDPSDYAKLQGRNFSLIVVEEAGLFNPKQWAWLRMLFSNLRGPGNIPCRVILTANPGGPGHAQVRQLINGQMPWHPFGHGGMVWVWAHGAWGANPHIDLVSYEARLAAACGHDSALLQAWRDGSWDIARGAFFNDVLAPDRQMFSGDGGFKLPNEALHSYLAGDWGLTDPAVCFASARLRQEYLGYPRGSLILLDEVSSADRSDDTWSTGSSWSPTRLGDAIIDMCDRTGCRREGVLDDSRGLIESVIEILRKPPLNLYFSKPMKKRRDGWAALRELMFNSKERNGKPGFWASDRCEGFWATIGNLPRDELHPDDVNTAATDHWADSARYAACYDPREMVVGRTTG